MFTHLSTVIKEKYEEDDMITAGELLSIFKEAEELQLKEDIKTQMKLRQQLP